MAARRVVRLRERHLQPAASLRTRRLGPSCEDVTHRFVLAGTLHIPGGIELTTITQAESVRPSPLQTPLIPVVFRLNGAPESL